MATPKVYLEELMERKAALTSQLQLMENHQADPQGNPSFGTHSNHTDTTEESIATVKAQIAELDELISNVGAPRA